MKMSLLITLGGMLSATLSQATIELAREGRSPYQIVIGNHARPVERSAASELQEHLRQITGADLPIKTVDEAATTAPKIFVGHSQPCEELLEKDVLSSLGPDGILIKTSGQNLILTGDPRRGALYAVYTFLEDVCGCRWWTSTESFIPKKPTLSIPEQDLSYTPALRYREAFYRGAFPTPFAVKLKTNGHFERIPEEFGGHYKIIGWCHTFFQILPPQKYFAEHPDWYSEIDGQRRDGRSQLCLTNKEMFQEYLRVASERIRKSPEAGIISISQNDWHGRCQCEKCRALEKQEESPAGPLIHFVNAMAAELEKEFPELLVETLAYQYTRKPPKNLRPRNNVVIRLCSIECSFNQPLETGEQNRAFADDIKAWQAIAPKLYVWDYVTNFRNYILPHPNLRVLAPNIRYFVKNKVVGLFEQGDSASSVGDFVRLRAWLLGHLMWNPEADENALIDTFLDGYYGPAGPHLRRYLDFIQDTAEAKQPYLRCFMNDSSPWLSREALAEAVTLYDKALAAVANDPVLHRRVRRERLSLDHARLQNWDRRRIRTARINDPASLEKVQKLCNDFVTLSEEHDARSYREGQPFSILAKRLQAQFTKSGKPPERCVGMKQRDWEDYQESQFTLFRVGSWVKAIDDPLADDGRAVRMAGNHVEWAVQCPLGNGLTEDGPWRVFVRLRCETTAIAGLAANAGVYDTVARKGLATKEIPAGKLGDGAYHLIELGPVTPSENSYVWIAPVDREDVAAIVIDRIFLIRAGAPTP